MAAWALLVLRYQYNVAWLRRYDDAWLDILFVLAIAGAAFARALDRRDPDARRAFAFQWILAVATTLVMIVSAEFAARFYFRHARSSSNPGDYISQHNAGGMRMRVNRLGFRERDIPPKSPARYRIVVVGDSFTWGQGIEEGERFSDLIEQQLGPRYEVLNFGLPAHNMPEHLDVLTQALGVSPDYVLLQLYINDFETSEMVRPYHYSLLPESMDRALARSSLLYDLVQISWIQLQEGLGLAEGYVHFMDRNLRDPDGPNAKKAFGMLKEFFERAHGAGVGVGAVLFPDTKTIGRRAGSYPYSYLHDDVRQVCSDEEVQCLDLLPMFSTFRDQRAGWVSPFDAHPNAFANREASYYILQAFGSVWQH